MNVLACSYLCIFMVEDKLQFCLQLFQLQVILALGDLAAQSVATDELGVYSSLLWHCLFVTRTVKLAQFL